MHSVTEIPKLLDVGGPLLFLAVNSLVVVAIILPLVVISETVVFRFMGWEPLTRAFQDALIANVVTSLVGCAVYAWYFFEGRSPRLVDLLFAGVVSIPVEGAVLWLLKRENNARRLATAVTAANLASYVGLVAIFVFANRDNYLPPVPVADIVYVAAGKDRIGFVKADGSNSFFVPVKNNVGVAYKSGSELILQVLSSITTWREGDLPDTCSTKFYVVSVSFPAPNQVVINEGDSLISLIDPHGCRRLAEYVSGSKSRLLGGALSPDGQFLLYSEVDPDGRVRLIKLDIKSRQRIDLGEGIYATWSPNAMQIAYARQDGIYLMSSDASDNHRLVPLTIASDDPGLEYQAPKPQWSPDGRWLVYDRCPSPPTCSYEQHSIYKVGLDTGQESKVIGGGTSPFWIHP